MSGHQRVRAFVAALAAAAALVVGIVAGVASPATAKTRDPGLAVLPPPSSCPTNYFCGYADNSYQTGEGYELFPQRAAGVCETASLRNTWTSVYNNTSRDVRISLSTTCSTSAFYWTVGAHSGSQFLWLTVSPDANDAIDAIQWR